MDNTDQLTPAQQQIVRVLQAFERWYSGLSASERQHLKSLPRPAQITYIKQHSPVLATFNQ